MTTVYNYYINVANYETKTIKIAGETVEEAESYAIMAGFEITSETVKAEEQHTGRILNVITNELEPIETKEIPTTAYYFKTSQGVKAYRAKNETIAWNYVKGLNAELINIQYNVPVPQYDYVGWCEMMEFAPH